MLNVCTALAFGPKKNGEEKKRERAGLKIGSGGRSLLLISDAARVFIGKAATK